MLPWRRAHPVGTFVENPLLLFFLLNFFNPFAKHSPHPFRLAGQQHSAFKFNIVNERVMVFLQAMPALKFLHLDPGEYTCWGVSNVLSFLHNGAAPPRAQADKQRSDSFLFSSPVLILFQFLQSVPFCTSSSHSLRALRAPKGRPLKIFLEEIFFLL